MAMKWLARLVWCSAVVLFASAASAQQPRDPGYRHSFSQAELDQMLAPIALYPDSLLSQILMAATYPGDVFEAASWSRANPDLDGDTAVRAVENEPWDPSVISLVAFPQVLAMMDERREWTERLGDAYVAQPGQMMDTIQELRARADAVGSLRTTDEVIVQRQGNDYVIEPPTPEVVYVPYYDPRTAYGTWWWSDYQPVYWSPWAGYSWSPRYGGLGWGYGVTIGSGFFFGAFDWPRRYTRYSNHRPWYYHGHRDYRPGNRWTHDRDHRWRNDRRGDGRWRDRGDRIRDGRTDRTYRTDRNDRNDRNDRRDWRGRGQAGGTAAPQESTQQGFFPRREDARTQQRRERAAMEQPASGLARPADGRYTPRVQQQSPQQQAPQQRMAPAPQPYRAPVQRQAPPQSAPPVAAPQPAAPLSRSSAERPSRSAPSNEPASAPEAPQRGGGGGRGMSR
jgi:uncharacterized protein DUF3300